MVTDKRLKSLTLRQIYIDSSPISSISLELIKDKSDRKAYKVPPHDMPK